MKKKGGEQNTQKGKWGEEQESVSGPAYRPYYLKLFLRKDLWKTEGVARGMSGGRKGKRAVNHPWNLRVAPNQHDQM